MSNLASKKEIEGFLNLVKKDEKLQSLVNKVDKDLETAKDKETLVKKELIPVAAEKGFNFTASDFLEYLNETTKKLEKNDANKVSGDGSQVAGKSKFGGGKIGKLLMLLGGGAAVGTSGVFAVNHLRNKQKAKTAQVQVQNVDDNEANAETTNDGLRPQDQSSQSEEENKTSDKLKETLNRDGSSTSGAAASNENKDNSAGKGGETAPAPGGPKTGSTQKSKAQMPKLSDAQIKEIDQKLDDVLNNKDGALDQIYNQAKAMDPNFKKEDLINIYRELRNAPPDQKMQFIMESMQAMQQMGNMQAAAPKK